jgi:hypothetical protein
VTSPNRRKESAAESVQKLLFQIHNISYDMERVEKVGRMSEVSLVLFRLFGRVLLVA